jgi:D-sedoheptulose 7-phosphate isomerase
VARFTREDVRTLARARSKTAATLEAVAAEVAEIAAGIAGCLRAGGTVYACGNGGSATQAAHFVGELVGRFKRDRRALPAVALSDNVAVMTALANDYGYDDVFAHQIRGLGRSGDCLLALSTSGTSPNVVRACAAARDAGVRVYGLTGAAGAELAEASDVAVRVGFDDTALVQEVHLMVIHLVCELVESDLFDGDSGDGRR